VITFDQAHLSEIMDDKLTVAEIAQHAGIAPSHVRYYQRAGLLPEPARVGRHVLYPATVLEWLETIASAREAGLSLEEIGELSRLRALMRERGGDRRVKREVGPPRSRNHLDVPFIQRTSGLQRAGRSSMPWTQS
jgi:DNA-binding transcriptional MerR regulator